MSNKMRVFAITNSKFFILAALILLASGCATAPYYVQESSLYPQTTTPEPQKFSVFNPVPTPLKPFNKALVVLDPGHGGKDMGTHSLEQPKYEEKHFTLATAKYLKEYLEFLGYSVVMTRTTDVFIELYDRAAFANQRKPQFFISIHYNSAPSNAAKGVEIFYYKDANNKTRTTQSKALGQAVLEQILEQTEAKSRNVKHGDYAVIRETTMPAILIEGGFLTNAEERQNLRQTAYLRKIAWGTALGIDEYWKKSKL